MKTAIVTGGSGGIGSAICRALAEKGWHVVVGYHHNAQTAKALAAEIGGVSYEIDVRNCEAAQQMASQFPYASLLVNNAGVAQQKLFGDITPFEWADMLAVHVNGAYHMCRAFLPSMIREKRGSIVNISSIWGITGASCEVHYSTAKAALIGFTKALAKEVGPSNITVNCIAPGVIETAMLDGFTAEEKKALAEETPLMRLGTPDDVAEAVLYAAEAKFLTGQVISPCGGFIV